jgi:SpoIID/LytB domain protein
VATYDGKPINALYSSTCGGRTEDAENIFSEKVPYLVSTSCEYKHPRRSPFDVARRSDWKNGVLAVARVSRFAEAARFMGLPDAASRRRRAARAGGVHPRRRSIRPCDAVGSVLRRTSRGFSPRRHRGRGLLFR